MASRTDLANIGRTTEELTTEQLSWLQEFAVVYADGHEPGEGAAFSGLQSLLDHLSLGQVRHGGTDRVWAARLWGKSKVFVVSDDMPLLVESVSSLVESAGARITALEHPVLSVRRDGSGSLVEVVLAESAAMYAFKESWIQITLADDTSDEVIGRISAALTSVLRDVRQVSADKSVIIEHLTHLADVLPGQAVSVRSASAAGGLAPTGWGIGAELSNTSRLLRWLAEGHFVFLGHRSYDLDPSGQWQPDFSSGSGVLRDSSYEPIRPGSAPPAGGRGTVTPPSDQVLVVAQSPLPPRVGALRHPYVVMVRELDGRGAPRREHRFLGMFPVAAMYENILDIPVVAERTLEILARVGVGLGSYSGQQILEVVSGLPRPELFSMDLDTLYDIASSALSVGARRSLRLFLREDPLGERVLAWVRLPQDRYTTAVRLAMQDILVAELGAGAIDYSARVSESALAWVFFTVRGPFSAPVDSSTQNQDRLQGLLGAQTQTWTDRLVDEAGLGLEASQWYAKALPASYQENFTPAQAVADLSILEGLADGGVQVRLDPEGDPDAGAEATLTLYVCGDPVTISKVLPLAASLGLTVLYEKPYEVRRPNPDGRPGERCWIYQFGVQADDPAGEQGLADPEIRTKLTTAFAALWAGDAEADQLGVLTLQAGLHWREVALLRAYAQYLRQIDFPYSFSHVSRVLVRHAETTTLLVKLFRATFDPVTASDQVRGETAAALATAVASVLSLDEDRVLQAYLDLMGATLRTNFFRNESSVITLKLAPRSLPDIPKPTPQFEVFVSSPRVEGVHLRFGAVARGGIRWSDRLVDYRTEILGLAKAQTAKNAVIVPVGAKGGFVVKRATPAGARPPAAEAGRTGTNPSSEAFRDEGLACYRVFISSLLELTDNIDQKTKAVLPPPGVVRLDGDDPYLVVAADKGTATFSDTANEIAAGYSFWLGDAFASGGSVGYDHKAMGITARGAWESVKRHFWELGLDPDKQDFTAVGVGDMSGDVFGNGMLRSKHIKLLAAFDHRHVFLDPDPDPSRSFDERERLFELPRSSWADYDPGLISAGGGVWERSAKSVPVSPAARAALGLSEEVAELSPPELIQAILTAPVDLLWNGGVGTYIKASGQTHAEAGDKSNDDLRVDGKDLRAKVVAEGGNLGATQLGRIEYARHGGPVGTGGRINTDAIDNSAGVDCSDHEVNIKILLRQLVPHEGLRPLSSWEVPPAEGVLAQDQRRLLLESLTDEIAELVLADNIAQNTELGVGRRTAAQFVDVHARQIKALSAAGRLDREVEFLPSEDELRARAQAGEGLTSPELSVLLAYAKLSLKQDLLQSDLPDNEVYERKLRAYFPTGVGAEARARIGEHALRRQIVATQLANEIVDLGGTTFTFRMTEESGVSASDAARAFSAAVEIFELHRVVGAAHQHAMPAEAADRVLTQVRRVLDRSCRWLVASRPQPLAVRSEIARYAPRIKELANLFPGWLRGDDALGAAAAQEALQQAGVPEELAARVGRLIYEFRLLDVVDIAELVDRPAEEVGELYFRLGSELGVDRVLSLAALLPVGDQWQVKARLALREDLYGALRALSLDVLSDSDPAESVQEQIADWRARNSARVNRAQLALAEVFASVADQAAGSAASSDLAALSVATRWVRSMVRGSY